MFSTIIATLDSGVQINLQIEFCEMAEHALSIRRERRLVYGIGCHKRRQRQAHLQWSRMALPISDVQFSEAYFCGKKGLEKMLDAVTAPRLVVRLFLLMIRPV